MTSPTSPDPKPGSEKARWTKATFAVLVVLMAASAWTVLFRVDLTPKVESDFFFSTEDPAFQATKRIEELFPTSPQILLSALAPDIEDEEYVERIRALSDELAGLD